MSDDWSLAGKKICASFDYDEGTVLDDENFGSISIGPKDSMELYPTKDIETLREKLIEDIVLSHYQINKEEFINRINKRFGVE